MRCSDGLQVIAKTNMAAQLEADPNIQYLVRNRQVGPGSSDMGLNLLSLWQNTQ